MSARIAVFLIASALLALPVLAAGADGIPRMPNGKPDLSGVYDAGTVTPVDRPPQYGDELYLSPEQAEAMEKQAAALWESVTESKSGGADREALRRVATATTASAVAASAATTPSGSTRLRGGHG